MQTYTIDFDRIDRKAGEDLFSPISRALDLPGWFGDNLDALWDMLTGYIDTPCHMILLSTGSVRKDEKQYMNEIMTANDLTTKHYLHDSSLIMVTRSGDTAILTADLCLWAQDYYREGMPDIAPLKVTLSGVRELSLTIDDKTWELPERTVFSDLPGVFDAEILEAKPLSARKLLLCLFLTKKDEQIYAELNVTADDFNPEVII